MRPAGRSRGPSAAESSNRPSCGAYEHKGEFLSSQILMGDPVAVHSQSLFDEKEIALIKSILVLSWLDLIAALIFISGFIRVG